MRSLLRHPLVNRNCDDLDLLMVIGQLKQRSKEVDREATGARRYGRLPGTVAGTPDTHVPRHHGRGFHHQYTQQSLDLAEAGGEVEHWKVECGSRLDAGANLKLYRQAHWKRT